MDLDLGPEHALLRDTIRDFMLDRGRAGRRRARARAPVPDRDRAAHRRARLARHPDPGGRGRCRARHAGLRDRRSRRSAGLGFARPHRRGPHEPRLRPLHLAGTDEQKQRYPRPDGQRQVLGRVRSDRARRRAATRAERGRPPAREANAGSSTAPSASSPTPATPGRTSSRPGPGRPTRATPRSAHSSSRRTRPGSASGGWRTSSASMPRRPASCASRTRASRPRTCSATQGDGFRTFLKILDGGRISIGALAVGLAQAALDASIPYAQTREQFGRPIGTFQGVAFMVADMATEIEAARALVWKAAWLKDQGRDYGLVAAEAKLFASEVSSGRPTPRSRSTAATATRPTIRSSATCATPS